MKAPVPCEKRQHQKEAGGKGRTHLLLIRNQGQVALNWVILLLKATKRKKKKITLINESLPFALRWHLFLFFPFPPGSGTIRATSCTLRSGTGWTSSALRRTAPGPRQSTSSTSSTSCRRGNRRTAARWWARPTSCWRATSPPASAASPSSSRSSRPTSGATNSRACTTTSSSVSQGSGASGGD